MALNKRKHASFLKNKHVYKSPGPARKAATRLGLKGIHAHGRGKAKRFMPGSSHTAYKNALRKRRRK
tara:strand:+ start:551 stop:751 length:201 start_codon:yes stop_codon:yes gene_type:complete